MFDPSFMYKQLIFCLISFLLSGGCSNDIHKNSFEKHLARFPEAELPLSLKVCDLYYDGLEEVVEEEYGKIAKPQYAFKRIVDDKEFITTISFGITDCMVPVINTFDLKGKLIDSKIAFVGMCGADCGFTCEEVFTLNEDYSLNVSAFITYEECDSNWNVVPNTYKEYILYHDGQISSNGKIEISEQKRRDIK